MRIYMEEKALTIKQVAEYLNVNERTIYKLALASKIPCFKVAGTWRFWRKDIEVWSRNTLATLNVKESGRKIRKKIIDRKN